MRESQTLFFDGFLKGEFQRTELYESYMQLLKELYYKKSLIENFEWYEKYPNTYDLFPNTFSYDDLFLDILFEQKIPQLLRKCIGENLYLGDMTLRRSYPGKDSYMGWHRDTYKYGNAAQVGRTPPLTKIIFYPNFEEKSEVQIKVVKGSHRRIFKNKIVDRLQTLGKQITSVNSSNDSFLLFDSSILHSAMNPSLNDGCFRVIYNFCYKDQLTLFKSKTREDLQEAYIEKMRKHGLLSQEALLV